jgi:poly-gamma-glutamate synthesis protein (capsule biosynthesis protein)
MLASDAKVRLISLCLGAVLLAGCSAFGRAAQPAAATTGSQPETPPAPPPAAPAEPPPVHARILMTGDFLTHTPLVYASQLGEDQWDFKPLFEPIRPWVEGANLAIGELETTLTGKAYPWSGYPSFNTPPELARDIKAIGYDVVTNANNHALDYDFPGVKNTADNLDRYGMPHTGTARSAEERDKILVLDVAPGLKMALLAYTYATNGIASTHPWDVNRLDEALIKADVARARQLPDVDLVGVALHMGTEYDRQPSAEQEFWVKLTLEAGADIIFGDHVHVVQTLETRQVTDQFGRDRKRAVIFCPGNLISNQTDRYTDDGVMALVDVKKEKGVTTVEQLSFIPVWTHTYQGGSQKKFRVVPVEKAIKDYEAKADPLLTAADYARLKEIWADSTVHTVGSPDVTVWHVDQPVGVSDAQ